MPGCASPQFHVCPHTRRGLPRHVIGSIGNLKVIIGLLWVQRDWRGASGASVPGCASPQFHVCPHTRRGLPRRVIGSIGNLKVIIGLVVIDTREDRAMEGAIGPRNLML